MHKTILAVATAIGLSVAGGAVAQEALDFDALDTDMNGELSFEELQAALPEITQEDFDMLDTDGSGALSPEEFAALMEAPAAPAEPAPADPMAPEEPAVQ